MADCFVVYRMAVHDDSRFVWSHPRCGQFDWLEFMCYFRGDDSLFFAFCTKDRLLRGILIVATAII